MNTTKICLLLTALTILMAGCGVNPPATATITPLPPATQTPLLSSTFTATIPDTATPEPTDTPIPTNTAVPTNTPIPTSTPAPISTDTPTPQPTYVRLRAKVLPDQVACKYGPGAPYLYKYGLLKGNTMEVLRRVIGGNYVELQAIGGNNPCWTKIDYLDIQGDLANVEPVQADDVWLPPSPYYGPATGVSARRDGNKVTVFWNPVILKAGDSSEQTPYVVEAFVCQNGQFVFVPIGSWTTSAEVIDEPGCSTPSRGWMTAQEKHGNTTRVKIPWPGFVIPAPETVTPTP